MSEAYENEIRYPDAAFVEIITSELVPILFSSYEGGSPDFQYLGGDQGRGQLESALARPKPVFGVDRYPSLAGKAATLIWGITKNHPFNDGNKRAALTTGFSFLFINRYAVLADQDDSVRMCLGIADDSIGYSEEYVSEWIDDRVLPFRTILDESPNDELRHRISQLSLDKWASWLSFYTSLVSIINGEKLSTRASLDA